MHLIDAAQFDLVTPLTLPASRAGHLTLARAVVEETMPGKVLVDRLESPTSAIILNDCGFHSLLGALPDEPLGPMLEWVSNEYISEEPGLLVDASGRWTEALRPLLGEPFGRREYRPPVGHPVSGPLLGGFTLEAITAEISDKFEGAVDPWVIRIWGGREAYIERAFGFAILAPNGDLASFCTTCGIGGGEAEIEVGTNDRYRQRGLARAAAVAFIAEARARGLEPAWTCQADNEPSWRLANSLGFREFRTANCFNFDRGFRAPESVPAPEPVSQ